MSFSHLCYFKVFLFFFSTCNFIVSYLAVENTLIYLTIYYGPKTLKSHIAKFLFYGNTCQSVIADHISHTLSQHSQIFSKVLLFCDDERRFHCTSKINYNYSNQKQKENRLSFMLVYIKIYISTKIDCQTYFLGNIFNRK